MRKFELIKTNETTPGLTDETTPSRTGATTPSCTNETDNIIRAIYVLNFYYLLHKRNNRGAFDETTSVRFSDIGLSGAVVGFSHNGEFEKKAVAAM